MPRNHLVSFSEIYIYGDKTLIKSANLAKFYRRMIRAIKTKSKRALIISQQLPGTPIVIYRRQLHKLYIKYPLSASKAESNYKQLIKNDKGEFALKVSKRRKPNNSNYLSYVYRANEVMEEEAFKLQIRNHSKIFKQAINKHLKRVREIQYNTI